MPSAVIEKHSDPSRPDYSQKHPGSPGAMGAASGGVKVEKHPKKAAQMIVDGEHVWIEPKDVADTVRRAGDMSATADLTNMHVLGEDIMGSEGMGIPRIEMPQFPSDRRDAFFDELKAEGVSVQTGTMDARRLRPTQNEIGARSTAGIAQAIRDGKFRSSNTVLVSSDGYILDGHHRWSAAVVVSFEGGDGELPVTVIDMPIAELLVRGREWNARVGIEGKAIGKARAFQIEGAW